MHPEGTSRVCRSKLGKNGRNICPDSRNGRGRGYRQLVVVVVVVVVVVILKKKELWEKIEGDQHESSRILPTNDVPVEEVVVVVVKKKTRHGRRPPGAYKG
jgi:hypothetical protein